MPIFALYMLVQAFHAGGWMAVFWGWVALLATMTTCLIALGEPFPWLQRR